MFNEQWKSNRGAVEAGQVHASTATPPVNRALNDRRNVRSEFGDRIVLGVFPSRPSREPEPDRAVRTCHHPLEQLPSGGGHLVYLQIGGRADRRLRARLPDVRTAIPGPTIGQVA